MSESFAWTHRNHLALGLDLRNSEGKAIFGRLVAESDAVFANFKPGTLTSLGFSYDVLHAFNPRIVLAGSSAFGNRGPWSTRMGYGPLVRAATGVTRVWTSDEAQPDNSQHPFYDATTIFPDHVVGRVGALLALAALIHRDRTGGGAHVHISQAEVVVNQLDTMFVAEAARATDVAEIHPDTSVHAVYPCAGDDEWCVISIRSDDEWRRATSVFGQPELANDPRFGASRSRVANRSELVAAVSAWTSTRTPVQAAGALQAAGVAAGPMNRPSDILEDPQLIERNLFRDMVHPLIARPLPAETGPAPFRHIPQAPQRPGAAARTGQRSDLPQAARHDRGRDRTPNQRARNVRAGRHCLSGLAGVVRRRSADCPSGSEIDVLPACSCFICEAPIWAHRGDAFGQLKLFDPQAGGAPPRSAARSARSVRGRRARPNCPAPPRAVPRPASSPG